MTEDTTNRVEIYTDWFTFDPTFKIYYSNFLFLGSFDMNENSRIVLINKRIGKSVTYEVDEINYETKYPYWILTPIDKANESVIVLWDSLDKDL